MILLAELMVIFFGNDFKQRGEPPPTQGRGSNGPAGGGGDGPSGGGSRSRPESKVRVLASLPCVARSTRRAHTLSSTRLSSSMWRRAACAVMHCRAHARTRLNSLVHSLTHTLTHSLPHPLAHSRILSLMHPHHSRTHSLTCSRTYSCAHASTHEQTRTRLVTILCRDTSGSRSV
jgi:hypothetical protein